MMLSPLVFPSSKPQAARRRLEIGDAPGGGVRRSSQALDGGVYIRVMLLPAAVRILMKSQVAKIRGPAKLSAVVVRSSPARDGGKHSGLDERAAGWMQRRPQRPRCGGSRAGVDAMAPRRENKLDMAAPGKLQCNGEERIISTGTSFSLDDTIPVKPTVRFDWYLMIPRTSWYLLKDKKDAH
uniref:Uncharacterized protein n=1 Tax=Oryza meridionalis TaxID=40149 RepID=A0A0E0EVU0_9ORYZ